MHTQPHAENQICHRDMHYPAEQELRRCILQRCRELNYATPARIIEEESRRFNIEVRARITEARMRISMRNAMRENYPDQPQSLRQLTRILLNPRYEVLTMTRDGADNLYGGSVTDPLNGHHILFISQRLVDQMKQFSVLHCDGTFKIVPAGLGIAQVFCIVGVWRHHIIPLCWTLMESRRYEAYTHVLTYLRDELLGPNIELNRFIMDFEAPEMLAVDNVLGCRVQGCLWHLLRRFLSYATDRGLIRPMRLIEPVRRIVRLTMAIPLLPERLIRNGLLLVTREAMEEGNYIFAMVRPYLQDIFRIWVRSARQRSRMCVHGSAQRTNNACESHNRILRTAVGVHPNIFAFIEGLLRVEQRAWDDLHGLEQGRRVGRARSRTSIMNDERINALNEDLLNPPGPINPAIMRFLRHASHIMDGIVNEAML